ncbi:hypothetical protein GQ53DRAFT_776375 [Thozetella sp. PMI_491]|nr:hypothetical protein GQ53DRAFT_776375 [Thozetella sp. PMI_491]
MDLPWLSSSYFSTLCDELEIWRHNLPANYAFIERHMYTFRVSRHLDIFLMIHAYYHQCWVLLSGAFVPEDASSRLQEFISQVPPEFIQKCSDHYVSHARDISLLIQKVLKVEPDHLFRDPWFGLCIWDSTSALLASIPWQENVTLYREDVGELIKLNLRALSNTMSIMPLADKVHRACCAAVRGYGLEITTDLSDEEMERPTLEPNITGTSDGLSRRYPFLFPIRPRESPGWDQLFHAANVPGPVTTVRPVTATPSRPLYSIPSPGPSAFELGRNIPNTQGAPYIDTQPMQMLGSWPMDDFQWWQLQDPDMDPAVAAAITGKMPASAADQHDHNAVRSASDMFTIQ